MNSNHECAGVTKSKTQCKRQIPINQKYCWQHIDQQYLGSEQKIELKNKIIPVPRFSPIKRNISPEKLNNHIIIPNIPYSELKEREIREIQKKILSKNYLKTGLIPVVLDLSESENKYPEIAISNQIYGRSPFTLNLPLGNVIKVIYPIKFANNKDYTLKQILDEIYNFYNQILNIDELEDYYNNDYLTTDLYNQLLQKFENNQIVKKFELNGDLVFAEYISLNKDGTYELVLGN